MFRSFSVVSLLAFAFACGSSHPPSGTGDSAHHGVEPLGNRFENAEEWAPRFDDPKRDLWQKPAEVIAIMEIKAGMHVADIGAGTGYFLPHLALQTGPQGSVVGLDIEADMVRFMTERVAREQLASVTARVVATDDPKLVAASLDRILIVDTWHHLPERVAYTRKLAAGLKPGGTLTIVDFTMETTRGPPKSHRLRSKAIVLELAEAGFEAELLSETLPDQFIVRGTKPL